MLICWSISWDDAGCEIRFEERIWLVEKINKLGNTLQSPGGSWNFKPDKLNKRKLTKGTCFFTFSFHLFSTSYYLEILKNPYRSHLCNFSRFWYFCASSQISLKFQLPPGLCKVLPSLFIFSTNQIRSSNRISHPASSHEIFQQISKSFAHFFRLIICFSEYF